MLAEGMVSLHPGFVSTRNLASSRLMVLQNAAQEKPPSMHVVCLCSWVFLSGTLNYCFNFMVKLDLKGSIDHGFGQGAFLVAPLGGIWVRPAHLPLNPPPGLPAIVHRLLGLAKCVQLWGFQR